MIDGTLPWFAIGIAVAAAAAVAVSVIVLVWFLIKGRVPGWPPRDWRALLALAASVAGAAILTAHRAWLVSILERARLFREIANIAYGDTVIMGLVLLALGYAISQRRFSGKFMGASFDTSGGDPAPGAPATPPTVSVSVEATGGTPAPSAPPAPSEPLDLGPYVEAPAMPEPGNEGRPS